MSKRENHLKNCKNPDCKVCKAIKNTEKKKTTLNKFLVKLEPVKGKAQPNYKIISTKGLWNQATEQQRLLALNNCGNLECHYAKVDLSKLKWEDLPLTIIKQKILRNHVDFILAGIPFKEWETFRKKHIILGQQRSTINEVE